MNQKKYKRLNELGHYKIYELFTIAGIIGLYINYISGIDITVPEMHKVFYFNIVLISFLFILMFFILELLKIAYEYDYHTIMLREQRLNKIIMPKRFFIFLLCYTTILLLTNKVSHCPCSFTTINILSSIMMGFIYTSTLFLPIVFLLLKSNNGQANIIRENEETTIFSVS